MEYLGRHLIVELYGCDYDRINNLEYVENTLKEATKLGNMHMVNSFFHKFGEVGVSGVIVIEESHISMHSWPEFKYLALDIFACGENVDIEKSLSFLLRKFEASKYSASEIKRGNKKEME